MPPLREYWRRINEHERQAKAEERAKCKARDKHRRKCRCDAYRWPHRPGGGLCRYPDPPEARWQDAQAAEIAARVAQFRQRWGEPTAEQLSDLIAMTTKPHRPYWKRYTGLLRQIARANGLHPIRDRALIQALMPGKLALAKEVKAKCPRVKYRNMELTDSGLRGYPSGAGPEWKRER
jgi:hypothetical protein